MGSSDSEPKEQVTAREEFLKGLGCNDFFETSLSVVFLKPCSNDRNLTFQSAEFVLGVKPGMEDLDLELRLGKPQKVI